MLVVVSIHYCISLVIFYCSKRTMKVVPKSEIIAKVQLMSTDDLDK